MAERKKVTLWDLLAGENLGPAYGAPYGVGTTQEQVVSDQRQTGSVGGIASGLYNALLGLAKGNIENSEALRTGNYDQFSGKPGFDAAMLPMGTGAVAGVPMRAGEAVLGAGPIRAYHGSPHDFDRFDLGKIGTGEGAQAYGHGLYFAENQGVAKAYKTQLSGSYLSGKDGLIKAGDAWSQIRDAAHSVGGLHPDQSAQIARRIMLDLDEGGTKKALRGYDSLEQAAADYVGGDQRFLPAAKAALEKGIDLGIGGKNKGKMYEVNIDADPSHFLDWDRQLPQ